MFDDLKRRRFQYLSLLAVLFLSSLFRPAIHDIISSPLTLVIIPPSSLVAMETL
jgi:hypothetical protein